MPALSHQAPPDAATSWFLRPAGQAVLDSEHVVVADALAAHPVVGLPSLWLAPLAHPGAARGGGWRLLACADGWHGRLRCRLPLPLASESLGAVVLQHVLSDAREDDIALIEDCARLLVPGGRLALLALNPLSPYRLRWHRSGQAAHDPATWRRLLADAGLAPEPVARGLGPQWSQDAAPTLHASPGLRASYLQRAEKRAFPMTPIRARKTLALADGMARGLAPDPTTTKTR